MISGECASIKNSILLLFWRGIFGYFALHMMSKCTSHTLNLKRWSIHIHTPFNFLHCCLTTKLIQTQISPNTAAHLAIYVCIYLKYEFIYLNIEINMYQQNLIKATICYLYKLRCMTFILQRDNCLCPAIYVQLRIFHPKIIIIIIIFKPILDQKLDMLTCSFTKIN